MKDFFAPEDFKAHWILEGPASCVAAMCANEKLNKSEMIKQMDLKQRAEEVRDLFSIFLYELYDNRLVPPGSPQFDVGLELLSEYAPRVKQECKHEPDFQIVRTSGGMVPSHVVMELLSPIRKCSKCGIELQATWAPK